MVFNMPASLLISNPGAVKRDVGLTSLYLGLTCPILGCCKKNISAPSAQAKGPTLGLCLYSCQAWCTQVPRAFLGGYVLYQKLCSHLPAAHGTCY